MTLEERRAAMVAEDRGQARRTSNPVLRSVLLLRADAIERGDMDDLAVVYGRSMLRLMEEGL